MTARRRIPKLGPYEILGQIGAGGMGEVYRAKDPRLGRDVAIKVLPASFSSDADRLRRFEQEARAAGRPQPSQHHGRLRHRRARRRARTSSRSCSRARRCARCSRAASSRPRKAIDYALQIAHGLAAAHEKGIVHRDLKPENLFVTQRRPRQDPRLRPGQADAARRTGSQATNLPTATAGTEPGVVLGTLGYMSPEQVRGQPADARTDIFSFGAILYEMLSGKRAFQGDSAADTMSAILKEDPPDLSVTNQNVSPGLERIVRHCLEKNPEQRFHSAHDLAFALEALSGILRSSSAGSPARSRRIAPRRGIVAAARAPAPLSPPASPSGRLTAPLRPDPPEIRPLDVLRARLRSRPHRRTARRSPSPPGATARAGSGSSRSPTAARSR